VQWRIRTIDTYVRKQEMKIIGTHVREEVVVLASSEDVSSVCSKAASFIFLEKHL